MKIAIWWIRRDFRLNDNEALTAALSQGGAVLPLFIQDPHLWREGTEVSSRQVFLTVALNSLDVALKGHGSSLILRRGRPPEALARLCAELMSDYDVMGVFAEEDFSPYARKRDEEVRRALPVPLHLTGGLAIQPPWAVLKADGTPYTVFTPYARAWKRALPRLSILPAPERIPTPGGVLSLPLPPQDVASAARFPAGEQETKKRLAAFVEGPQAPLINYASGRNLLGLAGTSGLSPYFRFGMLSARRAVLQANDAAAQARTPGAAESVQAWLNELIWRDFYMAVLFHFPNVLRESYRPGMREMKWASDPEGFTAWCEGRSGYPLVDAAARQLTGCGWVHNRARMIAASFLTKDLLIDWREGEAWYRRHLLDGDPAANNGGWQWCAGTGTDAAPFFRIFNPVVQSRKFDPTGAYLRTWLPELNGVPQEFIHEPWRMPADVQRQNGCIIGRDYPAPLVDHDWARRRAVALYSGSKT